MAKKIYKRDGRAPIPKEERTSYTMSRIRGKDTKPELRLRRALRSIGVRGYRLHWKKVPGRPDLAFPGKRVAVFVHGCYWHRCPFCKLQLPKSNTAFWKDKFQKNSARDAKNKAALLAAGWRTLTFWECELKRAVGSAALQVLEALEAANSPETEPPRSSGLT